MSITIPKIIILDSKQQAESFQHSLLDSLIRLHQRAIHGSAKTIALWISEKILRVVRPKMNLH